MSNDHRIAALASISLAAVLNFAAAPEACAGTSDLSWVLRSTSGPSPRFYHSLTFCHSRGVSILFGGYDGEWKGDTWEWNGLAWTLNPAIGPSPRGQYAMAYDDARGRLARFGGWDGASFSSNFSDTWEFDGTSWTYLSISGPSPRRGAAMAYDHVRGSLLLFGGYADDGFSDETWEFDGSTWTELSVPGPSPRAGHAMTSDTSRHVIVLFGGHDGASQLGDTWEWDGATATWTLQAVDGPEPRRGHTLAYDSTQAVSVLFGGVNDATLFQDTWEWNGSDWNPSPASGPAARSAHGMTYDDARGRVVLFGGSKDGVFDGETWELAPDCNGSHLEDACDIDCGLCGADGALPGCGLSNDCDSNGVPDECQQDFDGDEITDDCDPDIDNDGVENGLDACDFTPLGAPIILDLESCLLGTLREDLDGDCDVDLADYAIFAGKLTGPGGG